MKIGIFDPYLDTMGGGEKYMLTAVSCLAEKHDVFVFWHLQSFNEMKRKAQERFAIDLSSVSFVDNIFSQDFPLWKRLLITNSYDAIIYLSDGSVPLTLARKLIIHFQFPVEWVNGRSLKTRLKMSRVTSVICNSSFTKSYIDEKFDAQSIVLYPPVDIKPITRREKENIILHVGRFTGLRLEGKDFKKQETMVSVFQKIIEQGLEGWRFVLAIATRGEDKERVKKLREEARGFPIEIVENAENKSLWKLYGKAKIYWHATGFGEDLVSHPEKAEHFGIATVEAMSQGVVPVVINAGGQKEIVEDGKNGMLWETLEELKGKTVMLIENDSLWLRLSNNAKDASKRYSKERFCKELYEIIET